MILDRLLIRQKVNLLVLFPMVLVALLLVPQLVQRVHDARVHRQTAQTAEAARQVSGLVEDVQLARLLSVSYLDARTPAQVPTQVSADDLLLQLQTVADTRAQVARSLGSTASPELANALAGAAVTSVTGNAVLRSRISDEEALGAYAFVVENLIDALQLTSQNTVDVADAQSLAALDALLRADEAASQAGASLLVAASSPASRPRALEASGNLQALGGTLTGQFQRLATPAALSLFQQATGGLGAQRLDDATAEVGLAGAAATQQDVATDVFAAVGSQTTLRQLVEVKIARDLEVSATRSARIAVFVVLGLAVIGLLVGAIVVGLALVVGRSVSRPLRRLTTAARGVADLAQTELQRVADEDTGPEAVPRLAAITVTSSDEIGDLATAFNRVQSTAALLLERQVAGRRNVAAMFASVGRRTTNLVGRQLALIDTLEKSEEDPDTLRTLYRLDHVSTRLRRNASSLVVLSGASETAGEGRPAVLSDAVRAALGSVEEYQRVTLAELPEVYLAPAVVADVVLLLAELIENAVQFSPPHSTVELRAAADAAGTRTLELVDHGIGMPPERLAEENARLRRRERLDLAPTDVLGLFVVGRIARRYGIEVTLSATSGRGVTATVGLPASLFVDRADLSSGRPEMVIGEPLVMPAGGEPGTGWVIDAVTAARIRRGPRHVAEHATRRPVQPGSRRPPAEPSARPAPPAPARPAPPRAAPARGSAPPADPGEPDAVPIQQAVPPPGAGVPRRVPGTHWKDANGDGHPQNGEAAPAAPAGATGPTSPAPPTGPGDAGADIVSAPLDPQAARRQVEDLEAAMSRAAHATQDEEPAAAPPEEPVSWSERQPVSQSYSQPGSRLTGPPAGQPKLTRRVPGATLAALGTDASTERGPGWGMDPAGIDAEEVLHFLLAVDDAIVRARAASRQRRAISEERAEARAEGRAESRPDSITAVLSREMEPATPVEPAARREVEPAAPRESEPVPAGADDGPTPESSLVPATGRLRTDVSPPAETGGPDQPAVTVTGLRRRIPGATLAELHATASPQPRKRVPSGPVQVEAPEDVRAWVEEWEAAVVRAEGGEPVPPGRGTDESGGRE